MSSFLDDLASPWAQLIAIETKDDDDVTPIVGNEFSIGRGKGADFILAENKFVSALHCVFMRGEGGEALLKDVSTNGTLLNGSRLEKNMQVKLASEDIIRLVSREDKPELNITFKFNYLIPPEDELESTLPYDYSLSEEETTLEFQTDLTDEGSGAGVGDGDEASGKDGEEVAERKEMESLGIEIGKKRQLEIQTHEQGPESKKLATNSNNSTITDKEEDVLSGTPKPSLEKEDSIADNLTCQICQEILHDTISLQPCMHSYCAGCYSDWMNTSDTCPLCRNKVERINKNHLVSNLVDSYLRAHPDKRRPDEDLKELDAKNKITKDMLYPKKARRHHDYDEGDDNDYSSTDDDEDSYHPSSISPFFSVSSHRLPHPGLVPAPLFLCRQCPSHVPSSPPPPIPSTFTCSTSTNHVLCLCCLQPMPDRRAETDVSVPPQKCDICGQAYCHMYWGCRKPGCQGCLNLFKDIDFNTSILNGIINNGNVYESRVLKEYMERKSLTIKDVLDACCLKLETGEYVCSDSRTSRLSPSTRTCYKCALRNFKDLVYLYRKEIPASELPAAVRGRPDCYWGKQCRTQINKPHHAERFNHVCDASRHLLQ